MTKPTKQQVVEAYMAHYRATYNDFDRWFAYYASRAEEGADILVRAGLAEEPRPEPGWYWVNWYLDSPSSCRRAYWDGRRWYDEIACVPANIVGPTTPPSSE